MPTSTLVEISTEAQADMLAKLRRARYSYPLALLRAPPRAYGWCRTRESCATLALAWQAKRGITVSAETMRRQSPPRLRTSPPRNMQKLPRG
jgi:hypothetical protein